MIPPLHSALVLGLTVLMICLSATTISAATIREVKVKQSQLKEFRCQTCIAFSHEYSNRINDKKTDDHPEILNQFAVGNASQYLWVEDSMRMLPRDINKGGDVQVYARDFMEHKLLSPYAREVTLHAVHTAAHRRRPARVNWAFVWQVLCVELHKMCKPNRDLHHDRSFEITRHSFENFRHQYEQENNKHSYDELQGNHPHMSHRSSDTESSFHHDTDIPGDYGGGIEVPMEDPGMHPHEAEALLRNDEL